MPTPSNSMHPTGCTCHQCAFHGYLQQAQLSNQMAMANQMGLSNMFNMGALNNAAAHNAKANNLQAVQPTTYPVVYQVKADVAPQQVQVNYQEGDMRIYDFAVGKVPPGIEYDDIDVFLDMEDLPERMQRPAMMLHAAYNGEAMVLEGVGSVRPLTGGVLYFRLALT